MLSSIPTEAWEAESACLIWTVLPRGAHTHGTCEYIMKDKVLQGTARPHLGSSVEAEI